MPDLTDDARTRKPTEHETLLAWTFLDGLTGLQAEERECERETHTTEDESQEKGGQG